MIKIKKCFKSLAIFLVCLSLLIIGISGCNVENPTSTFSNETTIIVPTSEPTPFKTRLENYMEKNDIILTAKDVQFNMRNNLDRYFAIEGTAEFDDYYNYGFNDSYENDYFCINVRPTYGKFSDSWYLYLDRNSFYQLFSDLKNGNVDILAKCIITNRVYKDGQGNMAFVESVLW